MILCVDLVEDNIVFVDLLSDLGVDLDNFDDVEDDRTRLIMVMTMLKKQRSTGLDLHCLSIWMDDGDLIRLIFTSFFSKFKKKLI